MIVTAVATQIAMWPAPCPALAAGRASVNLELGTATTIKIQRPFGFALIGDPHVIDFQPQGERSLLLRPQGLGTTNLVIVDKERIVITNLTIVVRKAGPI